MTTFKKILALILVVCMICGMLPAITAAAADEAAPGKYMEIAVNGSNKYLSTVGSNGFNVFMYDNTFSGVFGDQHMSGIEFSLNGTRIATNGDLHMLPTPEQWDATPAPSRGTRVYDTATNTITVPMTFSGSPDGTLKYDLIAEPTEKGFALKMILRSSMPADLIGKARFNLEFLPGVYQAKTYQADLNFDGTFDSFGSFPIHAEDPLVETERPNLPSQTWYVKDWNEQRGNAQPLPFATGYAFDFAPEDPNANIKITAANDDLLELYDGRNRAQNGWYVLSTLITATKAGETAIEWIVEPGTDPNWVREPNVSFSQVGYAPNQEKFAVIELDMWDEDYPKYASLYRLNADGSEEKVLETPINVTTNWMRFKYARFDFSEVTKIGMYRVHYGDYVGEPFPIAKDVYDNIWQTCLSGFLAVQMDHISVREGYKIWHGASHMDDAYLTPNSQSGWYAGKSGWFDGMSTGSVSSAMTARGLVSDTPVDGLNKGGWFDAGDFDLQMSRNFSVLSQVVQAALYCGEMDGYDDLAVEWNDATGGTVEMHRPDGVPDVVQQAIHGSKQVLAEYEVLGGAGGTMETRYLRQYTHLGDPSSDTDGWIYDPNLEEGEVVERDGKVYSGVCDDRFMLLNGFSSSMKSRAPDFASVAYLSAKYNNVDASYGEYAQHIFNAAVKIWNDENMGSSNTFNTNVSYYLAAKTLAEQGISYEDYEGKYDLAYFKARVDNGLEAALNGSLTSNLGLLALLPYEDEAFRARVAAKAGSAVSVSLNTQPYGVNFTTGSSWGGSPGIYNGSSNKNMCFLYYNFPEECQAYERNILRSVNYILGCHPVTNSSWISGIGAKSALHPYNSNRAEESYIPGSILPGHITFSDYPETMGDFFNFLWFENESIIDYQSNWLPVGIAAGKIAHNDTATAVADSKDFKSDFDAKLVGSGNNRYFSDDGFNVFMYNTTFSGVFGDQHNGAVELVQNGRRIATNGDIRLLPTPEQWDSSQPAAKRGTRTFAEDNITVNMTLPAETFTDGTPENPAVPYQLIAEPEDGGIKLTVKLNAPLPEDLVGKAGFNMEFLPAVFMEKSYMADSDDDGKYDDFGVFPRDPRSDMADVERARTNNQYWYVQQWNEMRGNAQPLPFATGTKMTFAAEDDDYRIRIECEDGLGLYDGRNRAQNGWYVVRTLIPADATEVVWHISPDTTDSWTREPNISHSQVGYEPALEKIATIELDPNYKGSNFATLKKLNADGTYTTVISRELTDYAASNGSKVWKRYVYKYFDFSDIQERGTYVIDYDGYLSDPFPIDAGVYSDIWQRTLSAYLGIQMDHMRIREGYKIWRNAAHMDDALQAPKNTSFFDGWSMGGTVKSGYEDYEHIPGLDVGGFCDAGDFDIQTGSNLTVISTLALAYQIYGKDYDTLDIDWDTNNVELHRPDGTPDLVQLAKHGALQILAQLDATAANNDGDGFLASVIEVPTLRQYTHLGDGAKDTDGYIYDANLAEDAVYGRKAGKRDDRLAFFTTKNAGTNRTAAAALAATADILKGIDDETAARCLAWAEKIWATDGNNDWNLALNLYKATGKDEYKDVVLASFDNNISSRNMKSNGYKLVLVLDQLGDEYKAKFETALKAAASSINTNGYNANNPYHVSDSGSGWGGTEGVVNSASVVSILHKYYPDIIGTDPIYRAINYILGNHPDNSTSYVSSVGYDSVDMGYGSNRAEHYYISGGMVPGYCTLSPDLPEFMNDFNFLWFEHEYTVVSAVDWILASIAADDFARDAEPECKHDYKKVVTEPTCTTGGYTTFICNKCFDTYKGAETAALGHDDQVVSVVEPTCTKGGYTNFVCARCGEESVGAETEALGHEYVNGTCIRCGRPENIAFKQASAIEAGKQYVIVDQNDLALVNEGSKITAAEVTIEDGVITSEVADNMVWDFADGAYTHAGSTGRTGFYVTNGDSGLLSRGSGTTLNTSAYADLAALGASKDYYAYWFLDELGEGTYGMFAGNVSGSSSTKMYTPQYNAASKIFEAHNENLSVLNTMLGNNPLRLFEIVDARELPEQDEVPILHPEIPIYENTEYTFEERAADLVARMTVAQKSGQIITTPAAAIPASQLGGGALGVPATKSLSAYYWWSEALHGYNRIDATSKGLTARNHPYENIGQWGPENATSYPQSLTVGSTWNPDLYYQEARQVSNEIRELTSRNPQTGNAIDLNFYSPTVNLQRDPRWGRNEESYSEDPYLTVKMGSQYVMGLEGKNQDGTLIDPDGYYQAHSTIKHFVANNTEATRTNGGATSTLSALRNYYLAPYRGIIKATDVSSIMTAYSAFNGEPCSYSSYLMDTILRQTYGFSGYITSDCDSVGTMTQHRRFVNPRTGKTLTNEERLAGALAHGEDLECIGGITGTGNYNSYATSMLNAKVQTDKGLFTENTIDISAHRLLTARIATGEFDDDLAMTKAASDRIEAQIAALGEGADTRAIPYNQTEERLDLMDSIDNEGVVMLQNKDSFLPLQIPAEGEYKVVIVGAWQTNMYLGLYSAKSTNTYNHINIQKGITDAILAKNPNATFEYILSDSVTDANMEAIQAADVCIVVGGADGNYSKEAKDRSNIVMANNQASMFSKVGQWNPNTVAVMEYQGPVETSAFRDNVKSILWSSFGGLHKGVGFGNVLTGVVNPSGRLTATWYRSSSILPAIGNYDLYPTDTQVGRTYMYYKGDGVDYPFGYGLSYTTFEYSNLKIDKSEYDANDTVKATFDVKNTGAVAGKEVAQLYIAQPEETRKDRPIRRLEGFEKIELQPGESKTLSMEVAIPDLAYYGEEDDCYAVDTGAYQVQVGKDSASADLTADFTVTGEMDVYPETLTVKANAVGDAALGIEQRLIYDKGAVINPQLTVAMNDESLYGYIIKDQTSIIKSVKSCDLPEGMTFTYKSNRASVVKVDGDGIRAVAPGVATITVTGELDGHTVSADFVVYVVVNAKLDGINVNGEPFAKFDADTHSYKLTLAADAEMPEITAIGKDGMEIKVEMPEAIPGTAVITSTEPDSGITETYEIELKLKPSAPDGGYVLADKVEAGKQYVIVSNGYALTNVKANVSTAADGVSLGSTPVTVADGLITSEVSPEMIWDFNVGTSAVAGSYKTGYFVTCGDSKLLSRNGPTNGKPAPLNTENYDLSNVATKPQWCYWIVNNLDDEGNKGMFLAANGEWSFALRGAAAGFDAPGDEAANLNALLKANPVQLYEVVAAPAPEPKVENITINGSGFGFDPSVKVYNFEIEKDETVVPVIEATAGDEATTIEIQQLDAPCGTAYVTATVEGNSVVYALSFNYAPEYSYYADGAADGTELGKGLPAGSDLTMPAQGNWAIIVKAFIPDCAALAEKPIDIAIRQDADNAAEIKCIGSEPTIQPAAIVNGVVSTDGLTAAKINAAADGSAVVYFKIDKDGSTYTLYSSADGDSFQKLGAVTADYIDPKLVLSGAEGAGWFEYVAVPAIDGFDAEITDYLKWAARNVADYVAAALPDETDEDLFFAEVPHGYSVSVSSSDPDVIAADGSVCMAARAEDVQVSVVVTDAMSTATSKPVTIHIPGSIEIAEDLLKLAEDAQAAAEAAQAKAEAAQAAAEAAQTAAEAAKAAAETAAAETAEDKAAAEAAQAKAEAAQAKAEAAQTAAETAKAAAETAKAAAEDAAKAAAASDADAAAKAADAAKSASAAAADAAKSAASAADSAASAAEAAKAQAAAQAAQAAAEAAKAAADEAAASAAADKAAAEAAKAAAEAADAEAAANAANAAKAQAAAAAAQAAAQAAQTAAEEAAADAAADKTAADAAKAAAELAQSRAEIAQKAAEAAQAAAEAAESESAANAAKTAADAANAAKDAAEAAKAQAAAQIAQSRAEAAQAAAEAAQAKADAAAAKGEDAAEEAIAAQKAADDAKKAAQDAKDAAALSAAAAKEANSGAAAAAAQAAADAAKVAEALERVAAAEAKMADEAAKAEENAKAAEEAKLGAAKYYALTKLALAAGKADVADEDIQDLIDAIEAAEDIAAVDAALADALEALDALNSTCPSADFIDAPAKGNWAHEGIDFCIDKGYMNGTAANVFSPDVTVTRAQMVTILYRISGSPDVNFAGTFSDVSYGAWYSNAVEWAAANGVVLGIGEGKFDPEGKITREQIATILYRYSKADKVEGDLKAFPDGDTAGDFAIDGLVWAVSEGLITGVKNGDVTNLAPKDNATRAQIAAIIMRFLDGSYDCK